MESNQCHYLLQLYFGMCVCLHTQTQARAYVVIRVMRLIDSNPRGLAQGFTDYHE